MKTLKQHTRGVRLFFLLSFVAAAGAISVAHAQTAAESASPSQDESTVVSAKPHGNGQIEGRVYFPAQDRYLENVRVTIEGTDKVASTDDTGTFHFDNIPAGSVTVTAHFSGFDPQGRTVSVSAGSTSNADIDMVAAPTGPAAKGGGKDEVVKMEKYTVVSSRESLGSAIAEQEQRNAANMKTVVSTDEFGNNPTGNIGDFLRNLPGVEVDVDSGGESRWVALSGAGNTYVPVQMGGFDFASAASEGITGRTVQLQSFSMNNLSRLEVSFSPTPESPGDALGGFVNMVPRGAFESKRAKFDFSTFLIMSEREFTLGATPGPLYEPEKKTKPSWNFTYTNPLSKSFGFTVSGAYNYSSTLEDNHAYNWRGIDYAYYSGQSGTFPPPDKANPYASPYLSQYSFQISSGINERSSAAITADWRISRVDRLSIGVQYAYAEMIYGKRGRQFTLTGIDLDETTPDHVEGTGYVRTAPTSRRKITTTWTPTLRYMHIGSLWKIDAGIGTSRSDLKYTDTENGYFRSVYGDRGAVKIVMDKNNGEYIPHNIQAYDNSPGPTLGQPVDWRQMKEFVITQAQTWPNQNSEERRTYFANVRRDVTVWGVPVFLKGGVDVRHRIRDQVNQSSYFRYLGPDGIYPANTSGDVPNTSTTPALSDNDAAGFEEPGVYKQASKLIGLGDMQFLNNALIYNLYQTHPTYFKQYTLSSYYTDSRHCEEMISSGYFRGDLSFFNNKLYMVGGMRYEKTHVTGDGPLYVPASNGVAAHYIMRGSHNKADYDTWFPSANLQLKLGPKDQLVIRLSWFHSIGRPDFAIYNGTITLPDPSSTPSSSENTIQLTGGNAMLKPWTANTWRGEITYYLPIRGSLTLTAFSREYTNRHVSTVYPLTDELRTYYNIVGYEGFFVETKENSPYKSTMNELSLSYKQPLTFLPNWARGLDVYGSGTWRTKSGMDSASMTGSQYAPRSFKAGFTFKRKIVSLNANWNYRSRYIDNIHENDTSLEPGTLNYGCPLMFLNIGLEIKLTKNLSFWAQGDNVLGGPTRKYEAVSPSTPDGPKLTSIYYSGPRYTFGIKGSF